MRDERRLALLKELTESTRSGRLAWKALSPGAWDGYVASTPSRHTFTLSRTGAARWELEVRNVRDEVVDVIAGGWEEPEGAAPTTADTAFLPALAELVGAVDEMTLGPLEDVIGALEALKGR